MNAHPRRQFLLRVLAACGTPLAGPVLSARTKRRPQSEARNDTASTVAASYFGNTADAAQAIGTAYMRQLQVETTRASIVEHTGGARRILETARNQKAALAELVAAVRRDFEEGRVVQLAGWVVARTEAELCALMLLPTTI